MASILAVVNPAVASESATRHPARQLVRDDATTVVADVTQAAAQDEDAADSYQRWLADELMPLLEMAAPERAVSRTEFVFILEAIAARRAQQYQAETDVLETYCDIHDNAVGYLEGRVDSLGAESSRLLDRIALESIETRSPLHPIWQRKQTTLSAKSLSANSLSANSSSASSSSVMLSQAGRLPVDVSPSDPFAYGVELIDYLFGDISFEDGTFRADAPITYGDLIDYFSRQNAEVTQELGPVDVAQVRQNYEGSDYANRQLSSVLADVADVRQLMDELREAIASNNAHHKKYLKLSQAGVKYNKQAEPTELEPTESMPAESMPAESVSVGPVPNILSITEVPDVSASDAVYAPLKLFVEDYGIDMVQSDGNFNGEAALTRGEFARYLEPIFFVNGFIPPLLAENCERAGVDYMVLQTEVQTIQAELHQALVFINQR